MIPPFFTLRQSERSWRNEVSHDIDFAALPLGAAFECVYAPEATINAGWRVVRFRVVRAWNAQAEEWQHCYEVQETRAVSEDEAAELWESAQS